MKNGKVSLHFIEFTEKMRKKAYVGSVFKAWKHCPGTCSLHPAGETGIVVKIQLLEHILAIFLGKNSQIICLAAPLA